MMESRVSPYDWKLPVQDPKLFAGRTDELSAVREQLDRMTSSRPILASIALLGERRVGKTSFLFRTREYCQTSSIFVASQVK